MLFKKNEADSIILLHFAYFDYIISQKLELFSIREKIQVGMLHCVKFGNEIRLYVAQIMFIAFNELHNCKFGISVI
jgi:hypothetical protein